MTELVDRQGDKVPKSMMMGIAATQMNAIRICLTTAALFSFTFSILNLTSGKSLLGWVEAVMTITLGLSLWWSHHRPSLRFLENIAIVHTAAFSLLLFFQGGLVGIGYVWMLGFPFIACFIAGSRIGIWYSTAYALVVAMFYVVVQQWQIEVYWEGKIIPYLLAVYLFFAVIAYLIVISREKGENLAREAQNQLKEEAVALAESESRYKTLMDTIPNAVGVHRDGKWVYVNPAAVKLFAANSVESVLGTPVMDCIHPDYHAMVIERMQIQKEKNVAMPMVEEKLLRKNGEVFPAEVHASPVIFEGEPSFLTVCQDISERKDHEEERLLLQNQLEHAQRLESLGVLAGGIAHDFNNLLAAILGNAELARMEVEDSPVAIEHLNHIEDSCDQAVELCKQMLAYAGKGKYLLEVLNINSIVKAVTGLIRASVGSNITLKIKLCSHLPGIEGDMAQIQQIILNFIVNSAESIGEKHGEIKVTSKVMHAKRVFLDTLYNGTNLPEGEYVVLEVQDSGCGMDKEMQDRIFDPFFTTKETGTGLGLSAVLGIVRGHTGAVQLLSEPGQGATFRIFFPSTDQMVATRVVNTGEMEDWHGEGTILVVDDDPSVSAVVSAFVKTLDFDVMVANDGREGVNTFRKHHRKLAVVLLDMTMPQLGGVDAMREMREIDPSVPVTLVSGYSEMEAGGFTSGEQPDAFLQKPFKVKDLKKSLYKVLH